MTIPLLPQWSINFLPFALAVGLLLPYGVRAQEGSHPSASETLRVSRFPLSEGERLSMGGPARAGEYLGAVGAAAAWLGFETGQAEVWVHPLKVAREISLSFRIPQYSDPIPGADVARWVESRPGYETITYSHGAFQVKQHILAPREHSGILILLEVDAVVEMEIHVEFQPVMQYAWPGGMGGQYLFWDAENRVFVLSESLRERNAVIGSPWTTEASAHPAHRLAEAPSAFVIPVDAERAKREFIPIVIAGGAASREEVMRAYRTMILDAEEIFQENLMWAQDLRANYLGIGLGQAEEASLFPLGLEWAKVNLEEQRSCNPDLGCGLVAGWGPSGTSLRPGFGWYFGGDAAINSLAMSATGQWDLVAEGLRFLASYQRDDGKIPHEISQAAGTLPWFQDFPYAYYHADTTPFWMLALWEYWKASGDGGTVRDLWPAFVQAFHWCTSVETDGDGIIENTTGGLGAIEVGGLGEGIHQDIYLAAVWTKALEGTIDLAGFMESPAMASQARDLLGQASETLNTRYWRPREGHLAFGILRNGGTNDNLTAWPGTALSFGLLDTEQAEGTLRALASDAISSSWGARLLSTESPLFDPLHYNNGAVWPFMTGFVSWAQYRYRRPWAGLPLLRALHGLTFDFSLGRHPENLSGAYYQTMDATVPHQFFATSMLVTPLARGLLGWEPDAPGAEAKLAPQPPPSWLLLEADNLRIGESRIAMTYRKEEAGVDLTLSLSGPPVKLTYVQSIPLGARNVRLDSGAVILERQLVRGLHDQAYEVVVNLSEEGPTNIHFSWEGGLAVEPPVLPLELGSESRGIRILDFTKEGEEWVLLLEGDGGETHQLLLYGEAVRREGGALISPFGPGQPMDLPVTFDGEGRVRQTVRLQRIR